ncbi:MAG: ATP-binding protein [Candidatus Thermoplasmatota archaeon]|nr:ATP-binding protein [Candidatus Thermoplasmatota archaeon]
MDNPFRFGEPVTGDFFIGRDNEVSEIVASAKAQKSLVISGARHIGKSSLLAETARRNARGFLFVRVNSSAIADENQFLDSFTREIIRSGIGKAWRIEPALWNLLSTKRMRSALATDKDMAIPTETGGSIPEHTPIDKGGAKASGPQQESEPSIRMCPRCGKPLKWVEAYKRYFCYSCKKYAPIRKRGLGKRSRAWALSETPDSCPRCSFPLTYVHRYSDYYCPKCGRYPRMEKSIASEPWSKEDVIAALDLPQRLSELKDKPVVMMLDEIQEMEETVEGRLLEAMRLRFEEHEDVSFVFAGSAKEPMRRMFEDSEGAFYKFARKLDLGRMPDPQLQRLLISRFRSGDGRLPEEAARRIVGLSEGVPMYVQLIGHELFHISRNPEISDVESAIERVVRQQSQVYSLLWESIRSPLQKRYLSALAREPAVPHGEAFVKRYGLRSRSHVQRTESQLEARGIIDNGEILDPMLVLWLRTSSPL